VTHVLPQLAERAVAMAPSAVDRQAACAAMLDLITAAVAAPPQPFAPALREAYGDGPCALWLIGERASPSAAAFYNALVSARLDLDDGHRKARGHPGAAVIPAVLAEADRIEASGGKVDDATILRAIVVGYEVGLRIAAARGFYARTGFWAGFAAAAGAAVMRGLPPARLAHALAIAGETGPHMATNTAGPAWPQPNGSDVKEGIPWGVVHGLAAVSLGECGMTGALDLVDHAPFFDRDAILADLPGAAIHETYTKFHAACRHCHAPIDALVALMRANNLAAGEVQNVSVGAYSGALRIANSKAPPTLADAQYSIPYCLGLVATHGPNVLLPMTESQLGDAVAEAFARKVSVAIDLDCEARFPAETVVRVAVSARGQRFVSAITAPRGEAACPPTWEERLEKFRMATASTLSPAAQRQWLSSFCNLRDGRLQDVRRMLACGRGQAAPNRRR
jgi:2-methylcitrate dehydratase PrpD